LFAAAARNQTHDAESARDLFFSEPQRLSDDRKLSAGSGSPALILFFIRSLP
jgi:hypothetical protein